MASLSELDLARALLNSGYPVILPPSYAAFPQLKELTPATGPMVVVGYKVQKLSTSKAALWVRFTSPSEYVGKTIQMYPKSLEPNKGPACGADFSLLRAISASNPQATTLRDLGINLSSSAALTSTLLRHFCSMQKPRDSMTAAFDDHGTGGDLDPELQLLRSRHHSWSAHCTPPRMFLSVCLPRPWTPRTSTGTRRPRFWLPSGRCSWHQCCLLQLPCRLMTTTALYQNQGPTATPAQHPIPSIEALP